MKIVPQAGPVVNLPPTASNKSSGRDAAISFLKSTMDASQSQIPQVNPSKVSPEEMSAVKAPDASNKASEGQSTSNEASESLVEETPKSTEPSLSDKYAMLARREKALRARAQAQEAALVARESALTEREAKLSSSQTSIDTSQYVPRDLLSKNPMAALVEAGLTSDQITELLLNAPKADDLSRDKTVLELKAELQAIRAAQAKAEKSAEDRTQQSYQQAVKQIRLEAKNLIDLDPEFEAIKATNSVDDVVDLIQKTFDKDGILLSVDEAAREVESYLVEEALKVTKINKIKQRLAQNAKAAESANKPVTQQPTGAKTLTNNMTSSPRQLSARERAILAAKGELKG